MKTSDQIPRTEETLEERGVPSHSYFRIVFVDGSEVDERDVRWSQMSTEKRVSFDKGSKNVRVSNFPLRRIEVYHDGLVAGIDVPEGCEAFQAIRSRHTIAGGRQHNEVVGRIVGIARNDVVVEELFINGIDHEVTGIKV